MSDITRPNNKKEYRGKYDKSTDGKGVTDLKPIAPQCAASAPVTLLVKTSRMIGTLGATSGTVIDTLGNVAFDIDANFFSTSGRRVVHDAQKKDVGQIKRMHMPTPGIHDIWYLGPMDDIRKCSVRCVSNRQKSQFRHNFTANICKGEVVIGEAHGKWRKREFEINLGGNLAATVTRKVETLETTLKLDVDYWYGIKVAPGVDQAFVVLIVMGLDEISAEHPDAFM